MSVNAATKYVGNFVGNGITLSNLNIGSSNIIWLSLSKGNDTTARVGDPSLPALTVSNAFSLIQSKSLNGGVVVSSPGDTYRYSEVYFSNNASLSIVNQAATYLLDGNATNGFLMGSNVDISFYGGKYLCTNIALIGVSDQRFITINNATATQSQGDLRFYAIDDVYSPYDVLFWNTKNGANRTRIHIYDSPSWRGSFDVMNPKTQNDGTNSLIEAYNSRFFVGTPNDVAGNYDLGTVRVIVETGATVLKFVNCQLETYSTNSVSPTVFPISMAANSRATLINCTLVSTNAATNMAPLISSAAGSIISLLGNNITNPVQLQVGSSTVNWLDFRPPPTNAPSAGATYKTDGAWGYWQ